MDTAQWPKELGMVRPMQELMSSTPEISTTAADLDAATFLAATKPPRPRPPKTNANCPRCNSTNTKFCYYNNYSLTQPRYFCKTCRRYWTEGGTLRNVPIGGGSRKNKRTTYPPPTTAPGAGTTSSVLANSTSAATDNKLSSELIPFPFANKMPAEFPGFPSNGIGSNGVSAMDLLRSTVMGTGIGGIGGLMPMGIMPAYSAVFALQEFMQANSGLNFAFDGIGSGSRLFGLEDLKADVQASGSGVGQFEPNQGQVDDVPGYWNGMVK